MKVRTAYVLALCVMALVLVSGSIHAQTGPQIENPTDGDPCPGMTAEECFWGSGLNPPTTLTCTAFLRHNQGCWDCIQAIDPVSGVPKAAKKCETVNYSAGCRCVNDNTPSCEHRGVCDYHPY